MNHAYDPATLMASVAEVQAKLGEVTTYLSTVTSAIGNLDNPMHEFHQDHAAANLQRTAEVLEEAAHSLRAIIPLTIEGSPRRG